MCLRRGTQRVGGRIMRILRYLIVNLARERIATTTGTYEDALRVATELERETRQLHGIERG